MRFKAYPDAQTVMAHSRDAIRGALIEVDRLTTDRSLTDEDDFGVLHLNVGAFSDSAAEIGALGIIAAAEGLSVAWSDEDATAFVVRDLEWARANLIAIAEEISAPEPKIVELPHDDRVNHIQQAVMRAVARDHAIKIESETQIDTIRLRGSELLDDQQQSAVYAPADRDLLVNAGAGSGKTHMLTMRIAKLVAERAVAPDRCVVLSFSRAAREQIQERLNGFALAEYPGLAQVDVRTLHSLARRVLQLAASAGKTRVRPGFQLVTDGRRQLANGKSVTAPLPFIEQYERLFEGIADDQSERSRLTRYPSAINALRSGHPQLGVVTVANDLPRSGTLAVLDPRSGDLIDLDLVHLGLVWRRYEELLASHNSIDFAGMVTEALRAIRAHPALASVASAPYEHIFVDEFQDTSAAQNDLLFELASHGARLTCVGDGDQTIFSFAGADPASLTLFAERLHRRTGREATVLPLEHNYRSIPPIVEAAESVISRNRDRLSKRMRAVRETTSSGGAITQAEGALRYAAPWLALQVRQLLDSGVEPGSIAVLFRKEGVRSPQESAVLQHLEKLAVPVTTEPHNEDAVRVLSIHQAKGSQYDHVLCLYLGPGHFPDDRGDTEEERRLLYVAITRARDSFAVAGEPGAEPDLFTEFTDSHPDIARVSLSSLSDVLVLGAIDEDVLRLTDMTNINASILDWDEPIAPES